MKQEQKEQISGFMDGAMDQTTLDVLLLALGEDKELRGVWDRYHLIGEVMRGASLNQSILRTTAEPQQRWNLMPLIPPPRRVQMRPWQRLVHTTSLALAASIALLAISTNIKPWMSDSVLPERMAAQSSLEPVMYLEHSEPRWGGNQLEVASKLDLFLVNHHSYYPVIGPKGMVPYVTLVGYDTAR